jgi:UDP-3-O-[3-hydroxymyristoyl] glucosamine N-acyltransferase
MSESNSLSLANIRDILGAELIGNETVVVSGLADLRSASPHHISFLSSSKYLADIKDTEAAAVLVKAEHAEACPSNKLVVDDPYLAFAKLSACFDTRVKRDVGIHAGANVHESAVLGKNVAIAAGCHVGANAIIGDDVELYPGSVICERVSIGKGSIIFPNVVLYHDVSLGDYVTIHANSTIGSDGFGYAPNKREWEKIYQLGTVKIGNHVEIGSNTTIDRGALNDTVIHDGVIIDNQVHIAHNVEVGKNTAIAGCTGIAGSTKIGENCQLAGMVAVAGHIDIADNTIFLGSTDVTKNVKESGVYASISPMQTAADWRKTSVRVKQLDSLFDRVKKLERNKD